ncbi:MAG: response regulator [Campylobacterales bacterium]|nr:response regulator [Campylobacterales bacterium]
MTDLKILKKVASSFRVLYVEDNNDLRNSILHYLLKFFNTVDTASNGKEGLQYYQNNRYDLVITDIMMPNMDGLEMSSEIKKLNPQQEIIIVSAYSEAKYFIEAIKLGVDGYILKPFDYEQMNITLYKCVSKLVLIHENKIYKEHLEELVQKRTEAIISLQEEKTDNFQKTLESFVSLIEERDTYTAGHSQRVAHYSRMIAEKMKYPSQECDLVYRAGILHDIGKIATPDNILLKPGKLSDLEYKLIKNHVMASYSALSKIPMYKELAGIIIYHHERYDGKGYPQGKKGNEIPLLAHIMIVADAFDAMTTNRIYKGRKDISEAIKELGKLSGKQFHPDVVKAAQEVLMDITISETVNQLPSTETEKERFAYFYRDRVTEAFNEQYFDTIISNNFASEYFYINALCLHNFTQYNKKYGWSKGDEFLFEFVNYLSRQYPLVLIFRIHGDDFILLSKESLDIDITQFQEWESFKNSNVTLVKSEIDLRKEEVTSFKMLEKFL